MKKFSFVVVVAIQFDFMVSRIGLIALLLVEHFGPILATIKSNVAAPGIGNF